MHSGTLRGNYLIAGHGFFFVSNIRLLFGWRTE